MSGVVIASGFVVSPGVDGLNADSPLIGYENYVTAANVTATTENTAYPASYLGNPATHLRWMAGAGSPSSDEYLTVITGTTNDIDYVGIARHNFGTIQAALSVEGVSGDLGSPADWVELTSPVLVSDDGPVIFRFTAQPFYAIRLRVQAAGASAPADPYCAVMYIGKMLTLQRRIYVGHTPISYGRSIEMVNHRSVSGNFLGRIILSEKRATSFSLNNMTPAWYREYMDPFIVAAQDAPFFFAWRPGTYPAEVGYVWLTEDPVPSNQLPNGMMQMSLSIEGVA